MLSKAHSVVIDFEKPTITFYDINKKELTPEGAEE